MKVVINPLMAMPHIGSIWAYLSKDADGNEGLCAALTSMGPMPLIAADKERLAALTPMAEELAKATGVSIVLVEFTTRTELREIKGKSS